MCPTGWHVPTDNEWTNLDYYLAVDGHSGTEGTAYSGTEGTALKSTSGWSSGGNGTDDYGFLGLPGGNRSYYNGDFSFIGYNGYWWSFSQYDTGNAWYRSLSSGDDFVYSYSLSKTYGFSIRCLRD